MQKSVLPFLLLLGATQTGFAQTRDHTDGTVLLRKNLEVLPKEGHTGYQALGLPDGGFFIDV